MAVREGEKSEWRIFIGKNKLSVEKYSVLFCEQAKLLKKKIKPKLPYQEQQAEVNFPCFKK